MADTIVLLHIVFIVFFVGGSVYSLFNKVYAPYHLIFIVITVTYHVLFGGCPLTVWEIKYRKLHNPYTEYKNDSFYAHYFFHKLFRRNVTRIQVKIFLLVTKVIPGLMPLSVVLHIL